MTRSDRGSVVGSLDWLVRQAPAFIIWSSPRDGYSITGVLVNLLFIFDGGLGSKALSCRDDLEV